MIHDLFSFAHSYPQSAGYKEGTTSREAAEKIDARTLRMAVLRELQQGAGTADEIAERMGLSPFSVRPRCTELKALGKIKPTGERRRNRSGMTAHVLTLAA